MSNEDVRRARAYLLRTTEPPAPGTARFVAEVGPVQAAWAIHRGHAPASVLRERREGDYWGLAEDDLADADRNGVRLITPEDSEWPADQIGVLAAAGRDDRESVVPPLGLWVRGPRRLDDVTRDAISIVGARAATGYGDHVAGELAYTLSSNGITVWSGAAYGIDGAAHRGALAAGAATVAVLGCGINVTYPAGHQDLLRKIAETGLVVSEYAPTLPPARHRFPVRNRLIAALTTGVVVVEAGLRSGALTTASHAESLGRTVMAVPGPITSALSFGCHALLQDGRAHLVTSASDVLTQLPDLAGGHAARKALPS